jgi:hypothetical protein
MLRPVTTKLNRIELGSYLNISSFLSADGVSLDDFIDENGSSLGKDVLYNLTKSYPYEHRTIREQDTFQPLQHFIHSY